MVTQPTATEDESRPRTGQKARRTRARLLQAAHTVFARDGFVETRITDIASAAGVSHGTFYTYFTSKEEVLRCLAFELLERFEMSRVTHQITDEASAYEALLDMNRRYARMIRDNAEIMMVWRQAASVNADLRELLRSEDELFVSRAARGIQRFRSLGIDVPPGDDHQMALALGIMVKEYCAEVFSNGHTVDLETAATTLTNIWAAAVGISVPPS